MPARWRIPITAGQQHVPRSGTPQAREEPSKNLDITVVNSFIGDYEWLEFAEH
jgi:hypothetical protein